MGLKLVQDNGRCGLTVVSRFVEKHVLKFVFTPSALCVLEILGSIIFMPIWYMYGFHLVQIIGLPVEPLSR